MCFRRPCEGAPGCQSWRGAACAATDPGAPQELADGTAGAAPLHHLRNSDSMSRIFKQHLPRWKYWTLTCRLRAAVTTAWCHLPALRLRTMTVVPTSVPVSGSFALSCLSWSDQRLSNFQQARPGVLSYWTFTCSTPIAVTVALIQQPPLMLRTPTFSPRPRAPRQANSCSVPSIRTASLSGLASGEWAVRWRPRDGRRPCGNWSGLSSGTRGRVWPLSIRPARRSLASTGCSSGIESEVAVSGSLSEVAVSGSTS
mmetsp:Transcript_37281/g.106501  ORF Transcript_37281/g.106501 Transcript_37281/m.106501 type:complete len:256 (+) Transcript_37281:490-1257(+)